MGSQNDLDVIQARIKSKKDFIFFLENLSKDLKENPSDWENNNLERFIGAMSAWLEDMDGLYKNSGGKPPDNVNWQFFGQLLLASRIYE
jgi:hypothetical protein